jgi:hypothetical protein
MPDMCNPADPNGRPRPHHAQAAEPRLFPGRVSGRLMDNVKYAFLHFAQKNEPDFDCHS